MDTLEYIIEYKTIADKVALKKEELFEQLEKDVESAILKMSPAQTLSLSYLIVLVEFKKYQWPQRKNMPKCCGAF